MCARRRLALQWSIQQGVGLRGVRCYGRYPFLETIASFAISEVEYHFASTPQNDVKGRWSVCKPETSHGFSAVAYYFARRVHQETGIPIGYTAFPVSAAQISSAGMSQETLMNTPSLEPFAKLMRDSLTQYQKDLADVVHQLKSGRWRPRWLSMRDGIFLCLRPFLISVFGEKMFQASLRDSAQRNDSSTQVVCMRGVLWYQGEN